MPFPGEKLPVPDALFATVPLHYECRQSTGDGGKKGAVNDARFQVIAQSAQTVPVPEYQPAGVSIKRQSDPIGPSTPCERGSAESS